MVASVVLAGEFLFPNTYLLHMSRSILHKVVREIIIVGIALGLRRVDHGPHTAMIFSLRGNELGENRKLSKSVGRWRPAPRGRRSRPAAPKAAELKAVRGMARKSFNTTLCSWISRDAPEEWKGGPYSLVYVQLSWLTGKLGSPLERLHESHSAELELMYSAKA